MEKRNASCLVLGEFIEELPYAMEYLTIGFSPNDAPLKKRWENNGLSADFMAEYFRVFFISKQNYKMEEGSEIVLENLKDAVKYVANELLENAMKFQDEQLPIQESTARIILSLHSDKIIFSVTNYATEQQAQALQNYVTYLLSHDPHELYLQTMRNSAKLENQHSSGLGILSMICDYDAVLGWKFCAQNTQPPVVIITTMVTLQAQ